MERTELELGDIINFPNIINFFELISHSVGFVAKLFLDNPIFLLPFVAICVIMVLADKQKSKAVNEEDK